MINLSPDKEQVFRQAFRSLRPGGRVAVSDVVAIRPITERERADPLLWSSCSSGALEVPELRSILRRVGFVRIHIDPKSVKAAPAKLKPQASLGVVSADIRAVKPGT